MTTISHVDQAIGELLESADDPVHDEEPPDLDWDGMNERVGRLQPKLALITGSPVSMSGWSEIQDATFHSDVSLLVKGRRVMVRFSNFGSLFTVSATSELVGKNVIAEIVQAVSYAGFTYVPEDALATPYTGRNPTFKGATWWIRFFAYV